MKYPWLDSANKIFRIVIIVQWLISLLIAFITSSWLEPFLIGIPILALPIILSFTHSSQPISRYAYAIAVQLFAALHIQQAYGMTELHFEIFVMLAFLSYFRDWKVIAISTTTVALHHILFYIIQFNGGAIFIFEEGRVSFYILVIHALFALGEGILLGFMAKHSFVQANSALILSNAVSEIMRTKGSLDLKIELPDSVGTEEFKSLISAFKALIIEANSLSKRVSSAAETVSQSSEILEQSVSSSSEQVTSIASSIPEISDNIHNVAELSEESNKYAETAKNSTLDTKKTITSSSENITRLRETLSDASVVIQNLSTRCNNISEVMQSIKSVAEQTNLLALNAAIESARAGEHGRGFAVVADEVRNLAIKSKESAEEIELITTELITSADASVSQMNECVELVDSAVISSDSALLKMDSVVDNFQAVSENITNVATSAKKQANNVASISDSTKLLSGFSKNELSNVRKVNSEANELSELCKKLELQLKQFSV
ncbi:methyl-accepting chemotaxis protein [Paraglaciecola aquimarina]|uniref:Methyl-accepting chemotaxis protein n=1 Tax=Paraglaciecola algarum TaxID=3050085 RepID=A0ABS9D3X6_9ALTE|nr:methyl-accepting chemotaxis protein [Paraglaciecola sp. G1-23]MCF2947641.1 methyl-accepting chemotaxis protein [Paraglaciecola sp. G1-23]